MKKIIYYDHNAGSRSIYYLVCFSPEFYLFQYTVGIPFGGLKDHVDKVSWRGATFE